jgi:hypothetical protein
MRMLDCTASWFEDAAEANAAYLAVLQVDNDGSLIEVVFAITDLEHSVVGIARSVKTRGLAAGVADSESTRGGEGWACQGHDRYLAFVEPDDLIAIVKAAGINRRWEPEFMNDMGRIVVDGNRANLEVRGAQSIGPLSLEGGRGACGQS